MNLEQLRSFAEVAATGHFTKAAATLHLAQPSLSRQISTLEKELGAELFHRAHGHITLTDAGATLLPTAKRMLADAEAIRRDMDELAGPQQGRVRLGATPTLCVSLVAEAISRFHHQHPGIELELVEKGSRDDPRLPRTVSLAKRADVRATRAASAMESTILSTARTLTDVEPGLTDYVRVLD
jgi:DNA-binding transcriptional LysR family regulator